MKSIYVSLMTAACVAVFGTGAANAAADGPLGISAKLENPLVLTSGKHAHVLVRLKADKAEEKEQEKALNLALVIDRSGSMRGQKIEDARSAAIQMLERMRDGDRVALISYSDNVRVDVESTVLNETTRKKVRNAIHRISDDGSTNLGGGLVAGLEQVKKHLGDAEVNRVLLISDGLANRGIKDPAELNRIAREALQKGVITTTIGLGADYNEDLMTGVADHGGGNYYFVENSENIAATLNDEVSQMAATVAKNVALHITLPEGLELDKVHGWVTQQEDRTVVVPLGEFFSGQTRSVLWKFNLPKKLKDGQELTLGPIELTFNSLDEAKLQRLSSEALTLTVSGDKDKVADAQDVEVTARILEIELASSMQNASNLIASGKYEEAKAMLGQAVQRANEDGANLPAAFRKDIVAAAEEAEKLRKNVDAAAESAESAKIITKGGKASARILQKK